MATKNRSFKKSTVDIDNAEKEKLANDKARALESTYKDKIAELKAAKDEMGSIASKYAMEFDAAKVLEAMPLAAEVIPQVDALKVYLVKLTTPNKNEFRARQISDYLKEKSIKCLNEIEESYKLDSTIKLIQDIHKLGYYRADQEKCYVIQADFEKILKAIDADKFLALKSSGAS